jgi:hypothetical protein
MNYRIMNIEQEGNRDIEKMEQACDDHLLDLYEHHARGTGELTIKPTYHTKSFADGRTSRFGASVASTCAEANSGN